MLWDPVKTPQLPDVLQPQDRRAAIFAGHCQQPTVRREGGPLLQAGDLVQTTQTRRFGSGGRLRIEAAAWSHQRDKSGRRKAC